QRLRTASSDLANGRAQEQAYAELEAIVGELSDTDLSSSLSGFFGSIQDVLNQPEDLAVRNLAVLRATSLANDIQRLDSRVRVVQSDTNNQIAAKADDINGLLDDIAELNVKVVQIEASATQHSDAIGLRDERAVALDKLSQIIDIQAVEQENGSVTVFVAGDYLVFDGNTRPVVTAYVNEDGLNKAEIRLEGINKTLPAVTGELAGLLQARDEILGGFLQQLDGLSQTLIYEFNKVYSSGQGLVGHDSLASEFTVDDVDAALDQTGLAFTPVNGSFQVQVLNKQTGLTQTKDVLVRLNGLDDDTTLTSLAAALDAIDGLSASVTNSRALNIQADSGNVQFAFAEDTSGVLAALGLGTFFRGTGASDIYVDADVRANPAKFAASRGGIGVDTDNAVLLAGFYDQPLESQGGASLAVMYDRMIADTTQGAAVAKAVTDGFDVFYQTLNAQNLAVSGVSIDEEAVRMIQYQRAFQASAKFIQTADELLQILVNL
ncbi:MAG: flagellar hook-associated protein FlgK, partial [Planctomycetales bacterium]|nr:flagellar hook-associated protein FlgK [Planctomycetales bacterium]